MILSLAEAANRAETLQSQDATKKNLMGPILFSYYEKSLVSSNLNSKLLWFHSVRPSESTVFLGSKVMRP
jgi:hypothetical protein